MSFSSCLARNVYELAGGLSDGGVAGCTGGVTSSVFFAGDAGFRGFGVAFARPAFA
jgi:hypothetical protein